MHASDGASTPPVLPERTRGEDDTSASGHRCGNCGTPLRGEYCHVCGQPVHGLVRHFSSIVGDFFDTVFNYDARLPRTLWPLLVKPAFLTREYFAGRRVRYVSPVRLFVTLSIVTFFIAQLLLSFGDQPIQIGSNGSKGFRKAGTVEEVIAQRDAALQDIVDARKGERGIPGLNVGLKSAEAAIRQSAAQRISELEKAPADAPAKNDAVDVTSGDAKNHKPDSATKRAVKDKPDESARTAASARPDENATKDGADGTSAKKDESDNGDFDDLALFPIDGKPWNPARNRIAIAWLPTFVNHALNSLTLRAKNNIQRWQKNPDQFKDAVLSAVPSTLFVLLPVFALLLKVFYLFKRRLYMEHLIVALHSHAFLCLALLLMFGAMALRDTIAAGNGFWYGLLGWIEAALWIWMPLYLLLMQKRVYAQGWTMTAVKYTVLGGCYVCLLMFGAMFTVMFSVIWG